MDEDPPEVQYTDPALAPWDPWLQKVPPATFTEQEIIVDEEDAVSDSTVYMSGAVECPVAA
jgi:hypothetical protein